MRTFFFAHGGQEMNLYYSDAYVRAKHAFDTTRKSQWIAASLTDRPIKGVRLVQPEPLDLDLLHRVHHPHYVKAVQTGTPIELAESQGLSWDPGVWEAVLASNGGVVAAALGALRSRGGVAGTLSSGLHHAKHQRGDGFCTFNGLALATRAALDQGAEGVLILDTDAHCGGGTHQLIQTMGRNVLHIDIAVHRGDRYRPLAPHTLDLIKHADQYLATLEQRLEAVENMFEICLYNAGMDPFEGCAEGGLSGMTFEIMAAREKLVFDWCQKRRLPVAFTLAGGYVGKHLSQTQLVELHRLTIQAAADLERTRT